MSEVMEATAPILRAIEVVPYEAKYRDQVIAIGHEMHQGSIYSDLPFDEDKLIRQLAACGSLAPDRYFRLAVRGDEVLGGFFGAMDRAFFCDALLAHDMGWWVTAKRRGSSAAITLLADFERWAASKGAVKVMLGQSTERNIETTTKLYQHCGFRVIGFNAVKDLA